MQTKQMELDTIKTEHNFMRVGDPVPVNKFDDHDLHIKEHDEEIERLKQLEQTTYVQRSINILIAHKGLHEQYKNSI